MRTREEQIAEMAQTLANETGMGDMRQGNDVLTKLDQLLTAKEVMARLRFAHRTLYRKIEEEGFPAPIRFNVNCVRWRERDVAAWVEAAATKGTTVPA